jgi:hypothetical protein
MLLSKLIRHQKKCALLLITVMTFEVVMPSVGLALTSGPAQPEMQGFEPIGTSNLVDLFSGDFSYSIPLMDVGGYPLNLNYHSGSTPDDEASWVGFGWSLTPGAVTRQLRGLPDDFNGTEKVEKQQSFKDNITYGITGTVKAEFVGIPLSVSLNAGVNFDNFMGVGTTAGANVGVNLANIFATPYDANVGITGSTVGLSGNLGLSTSSMNGSSMDVNVSIMRQGLGTADHESASIGFPYSSRQGMQGMTLSASYSANLNTGFQVLQGPSAGGSTFISFVGPTYTPSVNVPFSSKQYSFSADVGSSLSGGYTGGGLAGYYGDKYIQTGNKTKFSPAYGFMNLEKGRDNINALMDYNLEKDIPYSPEVQYLEVPLPTNDLFLATSQAGSGQYTISRGEPGILFDPAEPTSSSNITVGTEAGIGDVFDVGTDLYLQSSDNLTQKWTGNNAFASVGDFNTTNTQNSLKEHAYFKKVGEPVLVDPVYSHSILGDTAVNVQLSQSGTTESAQEVLQSNNINTSITAPLGRQTREHRIEPMSYLTANEARFGGLDKTINTYPAGEVCLTGCVNAGDIDTISRVGGYRASHHLSQLTTIGKDGQRLVYGIPVYNTYQEEATFNINGDTIYRAEGVSPYNPLTDDTIVNQNGTTGYYDKNIVPPYSTSFLLTGMLSPDYVDVTGDGITDDDLGTAVKFNYTKLPATYQWRTPVDLNKVNYNEGMLTDTHDDQGNYTYGQKELWYMHSIESKTMVALFITENREDGFGVHGVTGGIDTAVHLQRLKEIRLYSKSDIKAAGGNLANVTPIKVAHFCYAYSLMPGIPNSVNDTTGKLTLKEVYFTFGNNQKGRLNPYVFSYYSEGTPFVYHHKQYDRWGQYKDAAANPSGMNNSEFPFTIQDTTVTNDYVSRWQLQSITLPSGGTITVHYESDDYAYVQDQRACQMLQIIGIDGVGDSTGVTKPGSRILIHLPQPVSSQQDLMFRYFQNMTYLFFKCMLKLDDRQSQEYVPGYGGIQSVALIDNNTAAITLVPDQVPGVGPVSPIASTGWQFIRANLPQYAYPGSNNLYSPGSDFQKAISSIATTIGNIGQLKPDYFPKMAISKHWSDTVDISKSFVRICSPCFKKLGGGARVSRLDISDQWGTMTGTTDAKTATYTQTYTYTTTTEDENGNQITISSGVASYEPLLGGEENPFHQPVFYTQKCILQLDRYYYIEQPFGESLFPSPNVGYSKVTVTSLDVGSQQGSAGTTVSEFYTAKDYPTRTSNTPLQKLYGQNSAILQILFSAVANSVGLSQGFVVENNDMHGKPKLESVYNRSAELISSTEYDYKTLNQTAETRDLDNHVKLVNSTGQISDGLLNQDIQYLTFMRDASSNLDGNRFQTSGGAFYLGFFLCPYGFLGPGKNYDHRDLRSSSTIKVVNNFGVLDKVIKTINGSSITTQNMLWDAQTGDVVLTKTQNEFNDPIYNLTLPAYWMYNGMGMAYQNDGTYLSGLAPDNTGKITNASLASLLTQGDEVLDLTSGNLYWVTNSDGNLRLINRSGVPVTGSVSYARVIHSGRRNILSGATATFTSLANPIVGAQLNLSYATKILDAKASEYNQTWNVPAAYCPYHCPAGYSPSADSTQCIQILPAAPQASTTCVTLCDGDHTTSYGSGGYRVYDGSGNIVPFPNGSSVSTANPWWVGGLCSAQSQGQGDIVRLSTTQATSTSLTPSHTDSVAFAQDIVAKSQLSLTSDASTSPPPNCSLLDTPRNGQWCGPLNRCGVYSCLGYSGGDRQPAGNGTTVVITRCITVPTSGTYYLGAGGDNICTVAIDGTTVTPLVLSSAGNGDNYVVWCFIPITLTAGQHTITITGANGGTYASMGAEIYNNTLAQIEAASSYSDLNLIFSTKDLIGEPLSNTQYACPAGYTMLNACSGDTVPSCESILPAYFQINPYTKGFLGNWRTVRSHVFETTRTNWVPKPAAGIAGATNIRTSGAYASFVPYWSYNNGWTMSTDSRWVRTDEATAFSQKGDGIESRDALNNYSSALFGYQQSLPVALASNAHYREIAYDGFEDYSFLLNCEPTASCTLTHFSFFPLLDSPNIQVTSAMAHTGHYSLELKAPVTLSKIIYPAENILPFYLDVQGNYRQSDNQWEEGFSPFAGKQYILSLWINDGLPQQATTSTTLQINGSAIINSAMKFPVVEGWKKIEVPFTVPAGSSTFYLTIQPSGTVYVDDIRIHPFDSEMKTIAYDASSQRVMAELDENNFATFYEYDDEGILIRVKKETEKGIMTIKETRSSYKYNPHR